MSDLAFIPAFLLAVAVTFAAVPVAIALARRTKFYDHPAGYKEHASATPYLGGLAVFAGFAAGALAFGYAAGRSGYSTRAHGARTQRGCRTGPSARNAKRRMRRRH